MELNGKSYARNTRFKLTNSGELFDLSEAPFKEILLQNDPGAIAAAARASLQKVLDDHPAAPGGPGKAKAAKKGARKKG